MGLFRDELRFVQNELRRDQAHFHCVACPGIALLYSHSQRQATLPRYYARSPSVCVRVDYLISNTSVPSIVVQPAPVTDYFHSNS